MLFPFRLHLRTPFDGFNRLRPYHTGLHHDGVGPQHGVGLAGSSLPMPRPDCDRKTGMRHRTADVWMPKHFAGQCRRWTNKHVLGFYYRYTCYSLSVVAFIIRCPTRLGFPELRFFTPLKSLQQYTVPVVHCDNKCVACRRAEFARSLSEIVVAERQRRRAGNRSASSGQYDWAFACRKKNTRDTLRSQTSSGAELPRPQTCLR